VPASEAATATRWSPTAHAAATAATHAGATAASHVATTTAALCKRRLCDQRERASQDKRRHK